MTLQKPIDPRFGGRLSASEFRERVSDPLYQNDVSLADRIATLESAVSSIPEEFESAVVPMVANQKDLWIDTSVSPARLYFCHLDYASTPSPITDNWTLIGDYTARNSASTAEGLANTATRILVSDDPPLDCNEGWIWVDSNFENREFRCTETYVNTDEPFPSPTQQELNDFRQTKFEPSDSYMASLLVAAEEGLRDGKTNTYVQSTVPPEADGSDTWIDLDDYSSWICLDAYKATDHAPWDILLPYENGDVVTFGGNYFIASQAVPIGEPTTSGAYWNDQGLEFATQDLYKESQWVATTDQAVLQLAQDVQGLQDGKTNTFYGTVFPSAAEARDSFVNSDTAQAYICKTTYDGSLPIGQRGDQWTEVQDATARAAIEAQSSIADGAVSTFLQDNVPTTADLKDMWIDTTDSTYEIYVCSEGYTSNGSIVGNWKQVQDGTKSKTFTQDTLPATGKQGDIWIDTTGALNRRNICTQTYTSTPSASYWVDLTDDRKQTFYLPDPPVAAEKGDGWLDTVTPSGQFQYYICNESYISDQHGFTDFNSSGKWTASRDIATENTANLALNIAGGKTSTYYIPTMPELAGAGDFWVDTDAFVPNTPYFQTYICKLAYDMTVGGAEEGANPTTVLGNSWNVYADPVSYDTALQANSLADNQRKTLYSPSTPDADDHTEGIRQGDLWVDTDDKIVSISTVDQANGSGQNPGSWSAITTASSVQAQLTADSALALAQSAAALQDGVLIIYNTSGAGDAGWPGPGSLTGSASQWAVTNWLDGIGAKIGDMWFHHDTTSGIRHSRSCIEVYDGYSSGDLGGLDHWNSISSSSDASLVLIQQELDALEVVVSGPGGHESRITGVENAYTPLSTAITDHTEIVSGNPHAVTATDVGLGNVANETRATILALPTLTGTVKITDFVGLNALEVLVVGEDFARLRITEACDITLGSGAIGDSYDTGIGRSAANTLALKAGAALTDRVFVSDLGLTLEAGQTVNEIEAILTNDQTHIPTSGAVFSALGLQSEIFTSVVGTGDGLTSATPMSMAAASAIIASEPRELRVWLVGGGIFTFTSFVVRTRVKLGCHLDVPATMINSLDVYDGGILEVDGEITCTGVTVYRSSSIYVRPSIGKLIPYLSASFSVWVQWGSRADLRIGGDVLRIISRHGSTVEVNFTGMAIVNSDFYVCEMGSYLYTTGFNGLRIEELRIAENSACSFVTTGLGAGDYVHLGLSSPNESSYIQGNSWMYVKNKLFNGHIGTGRLKISASRLIAGELATVSTYTELSNGGTHYQATEPFQDDGGTI